MVEIVCPNESPFGLSDQAIDAVIRRIRMHIKAVVPHQYNVTVRGYGFRFAQTTLRNRNEAVCFV